MSTETLKKLKALAKFIAESHLKSYARLAWQSSVGAIVVAGQSTLPQHVIGCYVAVVVDMLSPWQLWMHVWAS